MNRTIRCQHGYDISRNLCQECSPASVVYRERAANDSILVIGTVVGGSTIERRLGDSNVEMRCACDDLFLTTRSALWKVRNRGNRSCCARCRRVKVVAGKELVT